MSIEKKLFRILKIWQGSNLTIIMQVQPPAQWLESLPKKIYLIIDANHQTKGVSFQIEKPTQILNQGAIAQIIRKHMPSIWLADIQKDRTQKHLYILFKYGNSSQADWHLIIENTTPPLINFVAADKTNHFRFGKSGTFTKKQMYNGTLPDLECSVGESIIQTLIPESTSINTNPHADDDDLTDKEPEQESSNNSLIFPAFQIEAKKRLKRRLKVANKSFEKQKQLTPNNQNIELSALKATLLQQYAYRVKPEDIEITLLPEETGLTDNLSISLDPYLSVGKNIEQYFILSKKLKRAKIHGQQQIEKDQISIHLMMTDINQLETEILSETQIEKILANHNLSIQKQSQKTFQTHSITKPYRQFKGEQDIDILVGKSSTDNDELVKEARSNDYWFHVLGLTGSHVIIPFKSLKNKPLSETQKRQAAMLAIHFSKLRNDFAGDVYFSQKQFLRKKKGMAPGLWSVEKSESIYVKYSEEEIREILSQSPHEK